MLPWPKYEIRFTNPGRFHVGKVFINETFFPPWEAEVWIVYISPLAVSLCRLPRCSQRCVTYGKRWISQYTVCLRNMFWLTFHWSRVSLWLPAKIVAALFGRSPVGIYGGVSLSEDCWLVWVAAAYRPLISALRFLQLLVVRGGGGGEGGGIFNKQQDGVLRSPAGGPQLSALSFDLIHPDQTFNLCDFYDSVTTVTSITSLFLSIE